MDNQKLTNLRILVTALEEEYFELLRSTEGRKLEELEKKRLYWINCLVLDAKANMSLIEKPITDKEVSEAMGFLDK